MHPHTIIEIGTSLWWKGLFFSIAGILIILLTGKFSNKENKNRLRIALGIILISINLYLPFYQLGRGEWNVQTALPLNLCSLSGILSGVVLLWRNQLAYEFLLYWGISGATYSLLTPEMTLGNTSWYLCDYYISHAGIMVSCTYLTFICKLSPRHLSWLRIFVYTQLPVLVVAIIDKAIGANYMYLMQKPVVKNPFIIGNWPWYILSLEAGGLLHFFVVYLLFCKKNNYKKKNLIKISLRRELFFAKPANSIQPAILKIRNYQ